MNNLNNLKNKFFFLKPFRKVKFIYLNLQGTSTELGKGDGVELSTIVLIRVELAEDVLFNVKKFITHFHSN